MRRDSQPAGEYVFDFAVVVFGVRFCCLVVITRELTHTTPALQFLRAETLGVTVHIHGRHMQYVAFASCIVCHSYFRLVSDWVD